MKFQKKLLCDFDGVITDMADEAQKIRELYKEEFGRCIRDLALADRWMKHAEGIMQETPHHYGWHSNKRITAFSNEDPFVQNNALGSCLDSVANKESELGELRAKVQANGHPSFDDLATWAYERMVEHTRSSGYQPIEDSAIAALRSLPEAGVQVVIVSNSSTTRIIDLLKSKGLDANEHSPGTQEPVSVRGDAQKFVLGDEAKSLSAGPYDIDVDRPHYRKIILEEQPDGVVGDVFSLDLSMPLGLAKAGLLERPITLFLRNRDYTPQWSKDFVGALEDSGFRGKNIQDVGQIKDLI